MGLLDGVSQQYYHGQNKGDYQNIYQFVALDEIISNFMFVYVGESKIISRASKADVQFHGMRAIQELSYDVLRSHKAYEQEVPPTLVMYLPQDYVNYTKIVTVDSNGIELPIYPTGKTSNPFPIEQESTGVSRLYTFENGDIKPLVEGSLPFNMGRTNAGPNFSRTSKAYNTPSPSDESGDVTDVDVDNRGRRYGLDPQHAQSNGTFFIDNATGFIHFSSNLVGKTITLKYISDGLGTDAEMVVHKFCEEAVYKHIMYGLISSRSNIPEGVIQRFKREKFAETRKAKIRLSNIKMEEFTQVLKGISKPIK